MPTARVWDGTMLAAVTVAAALALALYAAAIIWLWFKQEWLLFTPTVLPPSQVLAQPPDVHELSIDVPGARLSAMHLQLPHPRGLVFFLHGNAGCLQTWFTNTDFYRQANFDLFMLDYRGYGKSTGRIESEAQLHADVRAAWDHLAGRCTGYTRIVIYGRSLGSGLAARLSADLSTQRAPDLTVLVSPYSSMAALAAEHYGWVPSWVLRYPMRTDQLIQRIRGALVLVDAEHDQLITVHHTDTLKSLVPHARLLRIAGAAHGDIHEFEAYLQALAALLAEL